MTSKQVTTMQPELDNVARGASRHAAQLVRGVVANDRDQARTAHDSQRRRQATRWVSATFLGCRLDGFGRSLTESRHYRTGNAGGRDSQTRAIAGRVKAGKRDSTTESNSRPGIRTRTEQQGSSVDDTAAAIRCRSRPTLRHRRYAPTNPTMAPRGGCEKFLYCYQGARYAPCFICGD